MSTQLADREREHLGETKTHSLKSPRLLLGSHSQARNSVTWSHVTTSSVGSMVGQSSLWKWGWTSSVSEPIQAAQREDRRLGGL